MTNKQEKSRKEISSWISRNKKILEELQLFSWDGINDEKIAEAKKILGVDLPDGYIWFAKQYGYGGIDFLIKSIDPDDSDSVVASTLRFREEVSINVALRESFEERGVDWKQIIVVCEDIPCNFAVSAQSGNVIHIYSDWIEVCDDKSFEEYLLEMLWDSEWILEDENYIKAQKNGAANLYNLKK